MESVTKSDIVCSLAGRDKGRYLLVIEIRDRYALLVDGKNKRFRSPKLKKLKHLKLEARSESLLAERIKSGEAVSNKEVLRMLAAYKLQRGRMTEEGS